MGDAEEVAKAALYLASDDDDASYMTGAEIVLDGGATSAPRQSIGPRDGEPPDRAAAAAALDHWRGWLHRTASAYTYWENQPCRTASPRC
jgi:hypothetical protein